MMRAIFARLAGIKPPPVTDNQPDRRMFPDRDAIFARRALRLHNRSATEAAKYERIHTILSRGRDA
jgi:hypothetical protein